MQPITDPPALRTIREAIRREWEMKRWAGGITGLVGISLLFLFFGRSHVWAIIGLALVLLGLGILYQAWRNGHPRNHPLPPLLNRHPRQIVWVYSVVTHRLPFGFNFSRDGIMYFKLADGSDISLSMPADRLKWVSRYLNDRLPHASFGYTRERQQWYMANPHLLMQEEDR